MSNSHRILACVLAAAISSPSLAQEESSMATQVELGAIITSGNTEDQNIKYKVVFDWDTGDWAYRLSSEGFRSKKEKELAAQRVYHVARAQYTINEDSFVLGRAAYEDDRFSGFDSQSDLSLSYGRNLLNNIQTMQLAVNLGVGVRRSETAIETTSEAILRAEANYAWDLSETADLNQDFSIESGSDSSIYRSESAIQTDIMENLSMKFSVKVKHQTEVPLLREKTDTETAVTLVWRF
jgi:putative salt-induced outer membrane protein